MECSIRSCLLARANEPPNNTLHPQVGMDRQQVLSLMGNPHRREMYGETEFLIYETNHWADSEKERFTPILLKNGKVAGGGRNYYDDAIRSKIEADVRVKSQ